jgi:NTP pyrophosphatase (non-canonical NTP hydrolase)
MKFLKEDPLGIRPTEVVDFTRINVERCEKYFHLLDEWSETDWGCALAGEVGELCNMLKKVRRGDLVDRQAIAKELGDIQAYLTLLAARLKIDLVQATINKFNEVSDRKNCPIKI